MNVLSLFDWMSCWQLALNKLWIKADNYFASEIDKYAIQVATNNFPKIIQIWDVTMIWYKDWFLQRHFEFTDNIFEWKIDLLIWWSPCQWFSFAGKQLNFNDERSKLFFEFVRLVNECKPRYFMLENVKMKKEFQEVISEQLFWITPIEINSSLVSAQNRKRLYWVGERVDWINESNWEYSHSTYKRVEITQPEDKWILLKDILENEVDEKYYINNEALLKYVSDWIPKWLKSELERSNCCTASMYKWYWNDWCTVINRPHWYFPWSEHIDKSPCIRSQVDWNILVKRIWKIWKWWQWQRVYSTDHKSVTLSALGWWMWAKTWLYDMNQISTLSTIRKLTPTECERLQTVPDNYTEWVSNSQRYKMLWNWWTVDVIAHIFSHMDLAW